MGHAKPDAWEGEAKYLGRGTDSSFLSLSTLIHEPCIFMLKYVTSVMIWHQITWTYLLELCSGGKKQVFQVSGNWLLDMRLINKLQSKITEFFSGLPLKSLQRQSIWQDAHYLWILCLQTFQALQCFFFFFCTVFVCLFICLFVCLFWEGCTCSIWKFPG